ncbi:MAG: hypothetical protein ACE5KA_01700, partial [Nitrososphaerales archaeon]
NKGASSQNKGKKDSKPDKGNGNDKKDNKGASSQNKGKKDSKPDNSNDKAKDKGDAKGKKG